MKTEIDSTPAAPQLVPRASSQMRVAIIFYRFGPYHHARLNSAGHHFQVSGVEACTTEEVYAWDKVDGAEAFNRITLTNHDTGDRHWRRDVQRKMRRALNEIKPQVVVIPGWISVDALSALWWCAETRTPAVIMSESNAWDEPRKAWKEWVKRRLVKMCAAGLAGGTPHADYLAQLGLARDRIFLGYDVVDNDYFSSRTAEVRKRNLEVRNQLGLPENYFLAIARFVEKKNLPGLLAAYARYREMAQKSASGTQYQGRWLSPSGIWKLVLLGDGPLKPALNSQLSALNLRDHVLMPGFKQYGMLPAYYGLASAFVHASTTEQWGLVVNEAMASGLPVLVSNRCGCARDLVQQGINGFTFNPLNLEEIAQRMFQLSTINSQPSISLAEMGAASQRIVADWGPQRFATGLRGAVTVALKNPSPGFKTLDWLVLRLLLRR